MSIGKALTNAAKLLEAISACSQETSVRKTHQTKLSSLPRQERTPENILQELYKKNPSWDLTVRALDPKFDPEIERGVLALNALIPQMKERAKIFTENFASIQEQWAKSVRSETYHTYEFIKSFSKYADRLEENVLSENNVSILRPVLKLLPYPLIPITSQDRPVKTTSNAKLIWEYFLKQEDLHLTQTFLSGTEIDNTIKHLFRSWNRKCDETPEFELRAAFIERLTAANWIGETLRDWRKLEDIAFTSNAMSYSRQEALIAVTNIFYQTYFEPMGLRMPIPVVFQRTKRKQPKIPAFYRTATGKIHLKVDSVSFGIRPQDRRRDYGTLAEKWNDKPTHIFVDLVEELKHKFDHEICKKYLNGDFDLQSPWVAYARPLVHQFPGSGRTSFYQKGTYYLLNPIERGVEGIRRQVFDVLNKKINDVAYKAEPVKSRRPLSLAATTQGAALAYS